MGEFPEQLISLLGISKPCVTFNANVLTLFQRDSLILFRPVRNDERSSILAFNIKEETFSSTELVGDDFKADVGDDERSQRKEDILCNR